jgi:hypothetical protein
VIAATGQLRRKALRRTLARLVEQFGYDAVTRARELHEAKRADGDPLAQGKAAEKEGTVYDRYSYATEKRTALDAWARRLDAIVSGSSGGGVVDLATLRR